MGWGCCGAGLEGGDGGGGQVRARSMQGEGPWCIVSQLIRVGRGSSEGVAWVSPPLVLRWEERWTNRVSEMWGWGGGGGL